LDYAKKIKALSCQEWFARNEEGTVFSVCDGGYFSAVFSD
jgi:hypothetical protein